MNKKLLKEGKTINRKLKIYFTISFKNDYTKHPYQLKTGRMLWINRKKEASENTYLCPKAYFYVLFRSLLQIGDFSCLFQAYIISKRYIDNEG